jgi:hypothetical protein
MAAKQRQHCGVFKANVAIELIREERTVNNGSPTLWDGSAT